MIENLEKDPHVYGKLIFDISTKTIQWVNLKMFPANVAGTTRHTPEEVGKEMSLTLPLCHIQVITLKGIET